MGHFNQTQLPFKQKEKEKNVLSIYASQLSHLSVSLEIHQILGCNGGVGFLGGRIFDIFYWSGLSDINDGLSFLIPGQMTILLLSGRWREIKYIPLLLN